MGVTDKSLELTINGNERVPPDTNDGLSIRGQYIDSDQSLAWYRRFREEPSVAPFYCHGAPMIFGVLGESHVTHESQ